LPLSFPARAGMLAVTACSFAVSTCPAHAATAVFGGTTKSHEPIVLKADKSAQRLRSIVIGLDAACDNGKHYVISGSYKVARSAPGLPRGGGLVMSRNAHGRFAGKIVGSDQAADGTGQVVVKLAGRLTRGAARGTIAAKATVTDQAGQTVTTCTAQTPWAASRRPGVIYGGSSTQGEPVVVRLDDSRRRVSDFLFSWDASCQPDGALRIPDGLTGFAVSTVGAFGDTFNDQINMDDGGHAQLGYVLHGKITRSAASGTVSAQLTQSDAAGTQQGQCSTGDVSWSVASG